MRQKAHVPFACRSNQPRAMAWWTWSEKTMASQTLASASLVSPEAGIELFGRGVDQALAVAAKERQLDALPLLRGIGGRLQNRQQAVAFLRQFLRLFRHDFAMLNFNFNRHVTHGAKLRLKTSADKQRLHSSTGTTSRSMM